MCNKVLYRDLAAEYQRKNNACWNDGQTKAVNPNNSW